jgi:hypothetical protein
MSLPLKMKKHIFDNVHGHIGVTEVEEGVIDSLIFQRLRGIRQTGCVDFVYPGSVHSRFSHCIGTMHLMGRFLSMENDGKAKIAQDDDKVQVMRLAALLHDLGHYPLSHTTEQVVMRAFGGANHEKLGVSFIKRFLKDKLHSYRPEEITDIIEKKGRKGVPMLLSSAFDVDKCDYLLRDSYYTGVSYGEIEVDRLIQTMSIEDGKMIFGKDETELERFLLGRYHMYRAVYHHKTVVGFEEMAKRAFEFLVKEGEIDDPNSLMKESDDSIVYGYNDSMLYQKILDYSKNGKKKELKELCSNIIRRRPSQVAYMEPKPLSGSKMPIIEKRISDMERAYSYRERFADRCGIDPMWIFPVSLRRLSLVDEKSEIYIRRGNDIKSLQESDTLILKMIGSNAMYDVRLYTKPGRQNEVRRILDKGGY